jgi:translation initiation factor 2 beta subunit (eIF-2beta)/eIF-5
MKKHLKLLRESLKENYKIQEIEKDLLRQGFTKKEIDNAINKTLDLFIKICEQKKKKGKNMKFI